jgi:hypothetical protein
VSDAAAAFAAGWALSGGPLGERFDAGIRAAVQAAAEHPGEDVTEATLKLGALTGIWATVYKRQDHLYAMSAVGVLVAWRKLLRDLDIAVMVAALRRQYLMADDGSPAAGTAGDSAAAARYHKAELRAFAAALAAGLLAGFPSLPLFAAFLADISTALAQAAAEGYASALAVAASQSGHDGFDWDAAQQDGQSHALPEGSAEAIAAAIIAGCVTDLAVTLTRMAVAGAAAVAMETAVREYLRDPKALTAYLQHAMGAAGGAATVAVFDQAQVERVLLITAGDARVCGECDDLEAANPYTAETFPHLPVHIKCRCNAHSEGGNAALFDMYAAYITQRRAA